MHPKSRRYLIRLHLKSKRDIDCRRAPGSRVTDQILRLVPNVNVFRDALRCIKLWASRSCLPHVCSVSQPDVFCCRASNILQCERIPRRSCLGHARCAYMSTIPQCSRWRDCQSIFYYHASMVRTKSSVLGSLLISIRAWPQPVLLKQIEDGPLQVRVWNPKVRCSVLTL